MLNETQKAQLPASEEAFVIEGSSLYKVEVKGESDELLSLFLGVFEMDDDMDAAGVKVSVETEKMNVSVFSRKEIPRRRN